MNQIALSSTSNSSDDSGQPSPARRRRSQLGLSTLLLATACVAAWGSSWMNHRKIKQLEKQVVALQSLARELIVKDREHLAIIQQQPELYDQQIWHVYVPRDSLALHLVTRDIPTQTSLVTERYDNPIASAPLPAGRHVIELKSELEGEQWINQVLVDGKPAIRVDEPKEWNPNRGSAGGGLYAQQADLPAGRPAILFTRIFMLPEGDFGSKSPTGPSNGIVLWISERLPKSEGQP